MARRISCDFCDKWLDEYAASLKTPEEREALSNALLTANRAWDDRTCHPESEDSDSRRARRIRRERTASTLGDYLVAAERSEILDAKLIHLAAAGLQGRQLQAWVHCYENGLTQDEAGDLMGITQQAVGKLLAKGRRRIGRTENLGTQIYGICLQLFGKYDESNWPAWAKKMADLYERGWRPTRRKPDR